MNSYTGRILRVDLTARRSRIESTREDWARLFVGGKGLGIRYLYEDLKPGTPPLSPENRLILMTGPLTGTLVPTSGKLAIITRSPATGTVLDCSIGGTIGNQIKHAGFDGIVLEGKASESIYLLIEDDRIRFIECPELRGKGSHHTELALRGKYGEGISVLSIGPAGENLCSFACITSEFYRQAGRGGVGAVMGSKNLKAIAVRGTRGFTLPDMDRFLSVGKDVLRADALSEANGWVYTDGTPMIVEMSNNTGILPTRNWQDGTFSGYEGLNSEAVKGVRERKKACSGCPLGCGNYIRAGKTSIEGPEYETLAIAGSNCGISDLEAVAEFNRRCDDLGLDSISSGATAAFAMELTEKGIHDFGLTFGDVRGYLEVPRLIAFREGIGAELSEGVRSMARKYGGAEFAMHVKGLELPGYDPRGSWGMGLAYATSDRGGCHMRAWPVASEAFGDIDPFTSEGKAKLVIDGQHYNSVKFSLILCDFWGLSLETMAAALSAVTGDHYDASDMEAAGERIYNLSRTFNAREGFTAVDDSLPARLFSDPLPSGVTAGKVLPREEFDRMLAEYYRLRSWDENGIPSRAKLAELGLDLALLDDTEGVQAGTQ